MTDIGDLLKQELGRGGADAIKYNNALRLLAKYRTLLLQNEYIKRHGADVAAGPFKGMKFLSQSAEGCHLPKLLGIYEFELHNFVRTIATRAYANIINVGCAEGYYAVGFKRMCPETRIVACDTDARAREACQALARTNGVEVDVKGHFASADFSDWSGKTLVWCDIEGAELELLDPARAPGLAGMDIVVELHPSKSAPDIRALPSRFESTHDITLIWPDVGRPALPPFFRGLGHLDQLLAIWEWRATPTPWAIMLAKSQAETQEP